MLLSFRFTGLGVDTARKVGRGVDRIVYSIVEVMSRGVWWTGLTLAESYTPCLDGSSFCCEYFKCVSTRIIHTSRGGHAQEIVYI